MSTTECCFILSVVCLLVECTRKRHKGYLKNIQIVVDRLGWKWIARSVSQLLNLIQKEVEHHYYNALRLQFNSYNNYIFMIQHRRLGGSHLSSSGFLKNFLPDCSGSPRLSLSSCAGAVWLGHLRRNSTQCSISNTNLLFLSTKNLPVNRTHTIEKLDRLTTKCKQRYALGPHGVWFKLYRHIDHNVMMK